MHGPIAPSVDLPPSCKALRDGKALALPRLILIHQFRQFWTRPYQTHFSLQNVEELWQFIQAETAQESSQWRYSWIIRPLMDEVSLFIPELSIFLQLVCIPSHSSEFNEAKQPAVFANALLEEKDRPSIH